MNTITSTTDLKQSLVEELRSVAYFPPGDPNELEYRAADEIERLAALVEELVAAGTEAVTILEQLDTLRHVDPNFPALDNLRAALIKALRTKEATK